MKFSSNLEKYKNARGDYYFDNHSYTLKKSCKYCKQPFLARKDIRGKDGISKFCSHVCSLKKKEGEAAFNEYYGKVMRGARRKKIKFSLSKKQVKKLASSNCTYCGALPNQSVLKQKPYLNGDFLHNGIDRITSKKGYVITNCVPCCKICNFMKHAKNSEEFLEQVTKIYKYLNLPDHP